MGFQSSVALNQGFGVVGEIVFEGPTRAQPGVVKGTAANIVVGRAFTIDSRCSSRSVFAHPKHWLES